MSWTQLSARAKSNVIDVLDSGWLSRHKYIPQFEKEFAQMHGAGRGILMNSGTDALRISLLTLKEIYEWRDGSEVIIPGLTFVATANAVLQAGLCPVFADVQMATGNIEPSRIARHVTPLTCAILAVHLFGLPANMPAVMRIARNLHLRVIEDSCETVGVHRLAGDMACFSFYQSHHVQTGVGGMIVTKNKDYEHIARSYMNHGRIDDGSHFQFGRVGYSSRATEMEAALGVQGIAEFPSNLKIRRELARVYIESLLDSEDYMLPQETVGHSWMFFPLLLTRLQKRNKLLRHLYRNGIESREAMPILNQPYLGRYHRRQLPVAETWTENGILLPLHPLMDAIDVKVVCQAVRGFFR
jgi:dTDP-4-amino-4,6-dideoxygalactose transaminase